MIKIGDKVKVKSNLCDELRLLEFEESCVDRMSCLIGTKQEVFDLWNDEFSENNQQYATINLCVEIPVQCLEIIE